jgi:Na+/phosphate symporter
MHGGKTARAGQRHTEQQARAQLARLDAPAVSDPLTALSEIAGQVVAFKDAMADRVNRLSEIRFTDDRYAEQLRSEVAVFERALDRCERFLTAMARLNIDERLAAIQQQQVDVVAAALQAALADLGLSVEQQQEAKAGVARHLRLVAS